MESKNTKGNAIVYDETKNAYNKQQQQQQRLADNNRYHQITTSTTILLGALLGTTTVLSSIWITDTPMTSIALGSAASLVMSWQFFQKMTYKYWWDFLSFPSSSSSSTSSSSSSIVEALLRQISKHRGEELIRSESIKNLKEYFTNKERKKVLEGFGLYHQPNELIWEQVHKMDITRLQDDQHQIRIHFSLEDPISNDGCEVITKALVNNQGKIKIENIKLLSSPPGWRKNETVLIS
ncbi:uncharacterized protein BX663DRAFT_539290 [Cokeromyces recurvatus]|uniref:uncharacterized protein n=1 Tax=Cokeromyces recurvatus TaxID=90255 RepID=UPI00221FBEB5|nr:uncharacterized protein BX663DRAFT_539290 [Cokeromyces recurvatus]KAI7907886.1 hypothetical protein BX663DRAFT_539290 [Cokeromyces recurvatus]